MSHLNTDLRESSPAFVRLACIAGLLLVIGGCSSLPQAPTEPPDVEPAPEEEVDTEDGNFTVGVGMLDAWNAVGQILVRLDGVEYEGRAQMLGMYAVRYRGERFLILTRALVVDPKAPGMLTKVGAVMVDGKPNSSGAALELLDLLQQRMPAELALIAAGGRGPVRP